MSAPKKRWILIGEWAGYRPGQDHIVHQEVLMGFPQLRAWVEAAHAITFTDGTRLILSTRDALPREKVEVKLGYPSLIRDCFQHNVTAVAALPKRR